MQLEQAASDTSRLMAALQPGARELPVFLKDADATARRATAALDEIEALAADGRALAQELKTRVAVLDRLDGAAAQLQSTTRNLEVALVGDTPPRSRPLLGDIAAASRSVERAATDLGDQPQSLLFGRGARAPGPGETGFAERLKDGK